jgi:hypothetical protein
MSRPALVEIQQADLDTMRVQRQHLQALRYLYNLPFGEGQSIVANLALTTTPIAVTHGLDRVPQGWLVVKQSAGAVVYSPSAATDPTATITLASTASMIVTLMFF